MTPTDPPPTFTAFVYQRRLAAGSLRDVLTATLQHFGERPPDGLLIFEDRTGRQVDFDLTGTLDEVLERHAPLPQRGPGRPRLGVVSREVTLFPQHWEWLEAQSTGMSGALRRLVDEAMKRDPAGEQARRAIEAAGRFMTALAGDLPQYEEATRALYARDGERLAALIHAWPNDLREHVEHLTRGALAPPLRAR